MTSLEDTSVDCSLETRQGVCSLTHSPLDPHISRITQSVCDNGAGAVVSFIGTTRDSFEGKVVTRLEYQAYSKLAMETMADIGNKAALKHPLIKYAIHHRLGAVDVGEASIVIVVSAPHRKAAFEACEEILEDVKRRGQIWKREYYQGQHESLAVWKANSG